MGIGGKRSGSTRLGAIIIRPEGQAWQGGIRDSESRLGGVQMAAEDEVGAGEFESSEVYARRRGRRATGIVYGVRRFFPITRQDAEGIADNWG